jgi:hypothetical protein
MGLDFTKDGRTWPQRRALDSLGVTKIKFYETLVIKRTLFGVGAIEQIVFQNQC